MQVDLALRHDLHHRHQQQQQPSNNTNPNHYMNVPFSVSSQSTDYHHLVSDPNGNAMGGGGGAESSDHSASSSAASSFVHLPLAGVDNISARSFFD